MRNKATLLFRLAPNYKSGANFFFFRESRQQQIGFRRKLVQTPGTKFIWCGRKLKMGTLLAVCHLTNNPLSLSLKHPHTHKHSQTPAHTTRITLAHTLCHTHAHTHSLKQTLVSLFSTTQTQKLKIMNF